MATNLSYRPRPHWNLRPARGWFPESLAIILVRENNKVVIKFTQILINHGCFPLNGSMMYSFSCRILIIPFITVSWAITVTSSGCPKKKTGLPHLRQTQSCAPVEDVMHRAGDAVQQNLASVQMQKDFGDGQPFRNNMIQTDPLLEININKYIINKYAYLSNVTPTNVVITVLSTHRNGTI